MSHVRLTDTFYTDPESWPNGLHVGHAVEYKAREFPLDYNVQTPSTSSFQSQEL